MPRSLTSFTPYLLNAAVAAVHVVPLILMSCGSRDHDVCTMGLCTGKYVSTYVCYVGQLATKLALSHQLLMSEEGCYQLCRMKNMTYQRVKEL